MEALAEPNGADHGNNTYLHELLRAQRDALHKQNSLARELLEVLRDIRDELAYARAERTKRADP